MSALRRGLIYWARLDKRRPALVVSADRFNARSAYVTVVPGTTRLSEHPTHVLLPRGEGGVERPTMLACEHVQELHVSDVDPEPLGGRLAPERMRAVEAAMRLYLDLDILS